jgi:DeoR/GlpR family transcriptional regulator of sugar metabolism
MATGGVTRSSSYEPTGPLASDMLDQLQLQLDLALLGVDAVDPEWGVMTHNEGEAMINRMLADRASRVIRVADSTKLGKRAFARIGRSTGWTCWSPMNGPTRN